MSGSSPSAAGSIQPPPSCVERAVRRLGQDREGHDPGERVDRLRCRRSSTRRAAPRSDAGRAARAAVAERARRRRRRRRPAEARDRRLAPSTADGADRTRWWPSGSVTRIGGRMIGMPPAAAPRPSGHHVDDGRQLRRREERQRCGRRGRAPVPSPERAGRPSPCVVRPAARAAPATPPPAGSFGSTFNRSRSREVDDAVGGRRHRLDEGRAVGPAVRASMLAPSLQRRAARTARLTAGRCMLASRRKAADVAPVGTLLACRG